MTALGRHGPTGHDVGTSNYIFASKFQQPASSSRTVCTLFPCNSSVPKFRPLIVLPGRFRPMQELMNGRVLKKTQQVSRSGCAGYGGRRDDYSRTCSIQWLGPLTSAVQTCRVCMMCRYVVGWLKHVFYYGELSVVDQRDFDENLNHEK